MNTLLRKLLVLIIWTVSIPAFGQSNEIPVEKRVQRMHTLNKGIYNLDFPREYIRETIVPETIAHRAELAPHYPQADHIFGEELDELLIDWITDYPQEYETYKDYLEHYLRSFK